MSSDAGAHAPACLRLRRLDVIHPPSPGCAALHAVQSVSLDLHAGETLALVGESGSGKSSLARAALMIPGPTSGEVWWPQRKAASGSSAGFELVRVDTLAERERRPLRAGLQMVLQDPLAALNPRWSLLRSIAEPLRAMGCPRSQAQERAADEIAAVGLGPETHAARPRQLSGGQRQRAVLARALVSDPIALVLDEALSALDANLSAWVLEHLEGLRQSRGLAILTLTHDLGLVRATAHRAAVLRQGRCVELLSREALVAGSCEHPDTAALFAAAPRLVPPQR